MAVAGATSTPVYSQWIFNSHSSQLKASKPCTKSAITLSFSLCKIPKQNLKAVNGNSSNVIDIQTPMCGAKKVTYLTPRLYQYLLDHVPEPQILRELREETLAMPGSQMQVSSDQAQMLAMLVQMIGAERCIEIGVYTGYSCLATALAIPASGYLVACDRDEKNLEVAKRYFKRAGVSQKVKTDAGVTKLPLK